jgi:membrane protease YdiL (CAAX protease family)
MAIEDNSSSAAETSVTKAASQNVAISRGLLAQPRSRRGPLSKCERRASLGYADVGLFFVSVFFIAAVIRVAVHFHILVHATADRPPLFLQAAISLFLIGSLYLTVRLRHGSSAWTLLGWTLPNRFLFYAALVGGIGLATAVDLVARATTPTSHFIHIGDLLLLDILLGPFVEESFFRGRLLPVLARTMGLKVAIFGAAVLFATLHPVKTAVQWTCFAGKGIAYGWIRVKSGSTVSSTLMHAAYNAALYVCQIL